MRILAFRKRLVCHKSERSNLKNNAYDVIVIEACRAVMRYGITNRFFRITEKNKYSY